MFSLRSQAQEGIFRKFMSLHYPEKIWIIFHPLSAKKAWKITQIAREAAAEMETDSELDGDANGGQVDAFRHAFWMALLAQKVGNRGAYRLGRAHEKGNYLDFKKRIHEEGALPDSIACEMDLRNNKIGIEIGMQNKNAGVDTLKRIIKKAVLNGDLWKIRKNRKGECLNDSLEVVVDSQWKGKWNKPKTLVPSNYPLH